MYKIGEYKPHCDASSKKQKKFYVYNIFIILSKQIHSSRLLLAITNKQKSNFNCKFKLESTNYHL